MRCAREAGEPQQQISLTQHRVCSVGACLLYLSFAIARKRAVSALRAELLFLSFPKEKGTKKKGNLRACALKDPLIVQSRCAQSKTECSLFSQLRVALRAIKLYETGKNNDEFAPT